MTKPRLQTAYRIARDTEQLRCFYDEMLGLPLKFADGVNWMQYDACGANFALSSVREAPENARGTVLVFEVDNLKPFREKLLAGNGHPFTERDMGDHGRTLAFADPEGNITQLFCRAQPQKSA